MKFVLPLTLLATMSTGALAQDIAAGEAVFNKCKACHAIGDGATNRVGPELNGVVDRAAGSIERYNYSAAMKASGLIWDEATLTEYLRAPKALVPGTKMTFAGLKTDEDIANLIAYLKQFAADGSIAAQ
ncbi:MAG: cytochrome c family protein [Devosia sp.]|uniref:c-type cytochrome n=1 Tax=Devosia sp. 66-22 TaxID=1895753 RepID=UPI00092BCDAE|nr:cytochrome c family protein [Devosia sp. 66-22]MBN9347511.1 cytochrome c family protein [Devosia sp.]OJX47810.1 MAG: hypothetical protein BGO81_00125 [Devosia sp. 66-22]